MTVRGEELAPLFSVARSWSFVVVVVRGDGGHAKRGLAGISQSEPVATPHDVYTLVFHYGTTAIRKAHVGGHFSRCGHPFPLEDHHKIYKRKW